MTDLLTAKRAFTEARKIADTAYLDLIVATDAFDQARTEYQVTTACAAHKRATIAYETARDAAKEARRVHGNLMHGLTANGGRC